MGRWPPFQRLPLERPAPLHSFCFSETKNERWCVGRDTLFVSNDHPADNAGLRTWTGLGALATVGGALWVDNNDALLSLSSGTSSNIIQPRVTPSSRRSGIKAPAVQLPVEAQR